MTSELDFIQDLQNRFPPILPVEVGIGDDGAVLQTPDTSEVIVTDMLLDGVHFDTRLTHASLIGRKAVAVNLSDLAAMGCRPTSAFVSLALPRDMSAKQEFLNGLYDGIQSLLTEYRFSLAGGDTNVWNGPFAINVCLTGRPMAQAPILRSNARPGDHIFVTGPLGGSFLSGHHLDFQPRIAAADFLCRTVQVNSMMDISDGLAIDLHRLTKASNVGASIFAERIPISHRVPAEATPPTRLQNALSDGEDFELLFTISAAEADRLAEMSPKPEHVDFVFIGTIIEGHGVMMSIDGKVSPLLANGWQHNL